ncbi:cardiolipin synthase [Pseudoflavonifractor phocaeensis]|uniref:cardiolipin synthase n=1 Tax=Pseudoflavonifractor phocaeensis TaxID=1870988 RepID=UPI00195E1333|nr:cardiolipin synthase [Pseudoflavonifractor phocaeensis]MBM6925741.1 cardiolipin synthase [Pseudoflavonifractor phocaeensis]
MNVKKLTSCLFQRTVIVSLLILLQLLVLLVPTVWISSYYVYVYWICVLLSALAVLIIVSRQTDPGYKIAWIIPILLFPMFGWLLYLLCGGNRLSPRQQRKMAGMDRTMLEQLEEDNKAEQLASLGADEVTLARYLEHCARCPAYTNTWTRYFPLGDTLYPVLLEELRKAERYIFLEYFIIAPGRFWDSVVDILKEKHAAGVDVRVIYDDVGSLATLPAYFSTQFEEETGIPCCCFNPFRPVISIRMNNRDHRKFCIIDGHTAFTGGINLADEYINQKIRFGHWKDSAILVKGEAAWSMTVMFLTMWEYIREVKEDYHAFRPASLPLEARLGKDCFVQPYTDNPLDNEPVGESVYLHLIARARKYIYFMTPYLVVSSAVNTALCNAAKSGVDVRIMTPHIPDKRTVFELTRAHYQPLLEAGVTILEYTPGFVHAKNVVADDKYGVVGTINMDYRSMFLHFENAVLLYRDPSILDIKADFLATQLQCTPITLDRCLDRSWPRRLFRSILRVLAPLA